jgi:molecular chaperone DnaK (HSP70)
MPYVHQGPDGLHPAPLRAATLAGLIPSLDSEDFALVYEPEAAALTACAQNNVSVEAGDVFLIVDAGGGTIDFTMHQVEDQAGSKVLSEATYRAMLLEVGAWLESVCTAAVLSLSPAYALC